MNRRVLASEHDGSREGWKPCDANVVPGWLWLITLLEVRVQLEAGLMVDGAVSIAVQSVYPGKQACPVQFAG